MNYRKIMAAALSLAMLSGMTGCGKDTDNETTESSVTISESSETSKSSKDKEKESSKADESSREESSKADKSEKTDEKKSKETKAEESKSDSTKTTTAKASGGSSGGNSNSSSGGSSGNNSSSGGSSGSSGSSGGSSETGNSGSSGGQSTTEAPQEEKTYTAEITLGSTNSVKGTNAAVNGKVVKINAGGDYLVKGKAADAQIMVETATEDKVTVILDGVDIACSDGPAIFVNEAKRCTIKLAEGSKNYLRDGGTDKINDGVIFSNDTLRFKGSGSIEINSGNAHGIASDDDVIIENGTFVINSIKSGIFAHDDITINDGNITVYGGTNGLKSKGTVNINGGTSWISGGSKEEKSSIYASAAFYYTGGCVYAAGNKVTAPASTPNPYVVMSFGDPVGGGTELGIYLNGGEQTKFRPHGEFRCVLFMSPDISSGASFAASLDGGQIADQGLGDGQNLIKVE